jgi:hypothetical protein
MLSTFLLKEDLCREKGDSLFLVSFVGRCHGNPPIFNGTRLSNSSGDLCLQLSFQFSGGCDGVGDLCLGECEGSESEQFVSKGDTNGHIS